MKDTDFTLVLAERREAVRANLAAIFRTAGSPGGAEAATAGVVERPLAPPAADFVWEVGCGHGHFLAAYAAAHPSQVCIGVDIASDRIARARKKAERARLANLHFLRTEASLFLEAMPSSVRIGTVFVLFPDPWPKLRHHKHRVLQPEFLENVARRAAEGCRLHFRTDFEPYFQNARATVAAAPAWSLVDVPWPFEFETVFQNRAADGYHSFIAQLRSQP